MTRIPRPEATVFLAFTALLATALLSGCGPEDATGAERPSAPPGPTSTSTVAPQPAVDLAERYRQAGGAADVYGIRVDEAPGDVPLIVVWTRNGTEDATVFDELKVSVTGFLTRSKDLSLRDGYLMDVFGPDGSLQHRLDARP